MLALELLKEDRDYCLSINNDKSIIEKYDKAITELEDLQNRSCKNCKFGMTYPYDDDDIECVKIEADTQGMYFTSDFCCNKWEKR